VKGAEASPVRALEVPRTEADERKLDQVLADSFPASDPPPWTLGRAPSARRIDRPSLSIQAVEVVVAGGRRTWAQQLMVGIGALGAGLVIPLGILIVGLPIALAARGVIEVVAWLTAWMVG
jgi:hypothetical protein